MTRPLALTMGDPAGIGAEITAAAWDALRKTGPVFIAVADPGWLAPQNIPMRVIADPSEVRDMSDALPVLPVTPSLPRPVVPGQADLAAAASTVASIDQAVALVQAGVCSAVVTNPINKKVLQDGAGFAYPGHTEYLAHLGGVDRSVMMLSAAGLRAVPVTIHIALSEVPQALTPALLRETAQITHSALRTRFGLKAPRLAVAGLNPHAGEAGAMGAEELDWINGCVATLAAGGMDITGPLPADTMFHARARASYDAALCMYHDQALIPVKTLDFEGGVNITLGLPFVRTSPDHGTAFDIAGRGVASATSLINALVEADRMARAGD
ncbi:MAG: 4-hydroxythreonine-4-phosphate dehydrogenase PdxA [Pseudomonadota bacterium]